MYPNTSDSASHLSISLSMKKTHGLSNGIKGICILFCSNICVHVVLVSFLSFVLFMLKSMSQSYTFILSC